MLFAVVNTDQCIGGSLEDAFTNAWDCVLLSSGAGMTSPDYSQESVEFNCAKAWGFCMKCEDFGTKRQTPTSSSQKRRSSQYNGPSKAVYLFLPV